MMMIRLIMLFYILQWNARSLIANGQELKKVVDIGEDKPDLICIQETWLKPCLDFVIPGYDSVREDLKEGTGGGCATFVKAGVQYQRVALSTTLECVAVRVWGEHGRMNVINFYNPCKQIWWV